MVLICCTFAYFDAIVSESQCRSECFIPLQCYMLEDSPTRLQTAREAQDTAVPCGMSTHGRWAGPARRSLLFCPSEHTETGQVRARRRRRRARSLLYSFVNTFDVINCTWPCKCAAKQNHLLNQQKSEPRPVLGLIGSGSEHIDSSIGAQLPHSTGYITLIYNMLYNSCDVLYRIYL